MKMQKVGGYASIISVCVVIAYLAIVLPLSARYGLNEAGAGLEPAKLMAVYTGSPIVVKMLFPIDILIAILTLLVVLGIQDRTQAKAPYLTRLLVIATAISAGLRLVGMMNGIQGFASMVGAKDISIYRPFLAMLGGFSAAADHAWGWSMLLIAFAGLSTAALPRLLNYMFLVLGIFSVIGFTFSLAGAAGIVVTVIFGLLAIAASVWLGVVLIKAEQSMPAPKEMAAARG